MTINQFYFLAKKKLFLICRSIILNGVRKTLHEIKKKLDKTIRFVLIPETIRAIIYLKKNLKYLKNNIIGGFNLGYLGYNRNYSFMPSKYGKTLSDDVSKLRFKKLNLKYKKYSFLQRGSAERQYNSPGVDLPIASIFNAKYGEYPRYHTSLDNFKLANIKEIMGGFKALKTAIQILLDFKILKIIRINIRETKRIYILLKKKRVIE